MLTPDVILAVGTLSVAALQRESRTIPIVFDSVSDPVGAGFVDSLAHPGGNTTGFMIYEYGWNSSSRWRPGLSERVFFGIPPILLGSLNLAPSGPWRRRLGWM